MTEQVTITPQAALDANDDPLPAGDPFTVLALVAPGDTTQRPGADAQLDVVEFTAYLPLRVKLAGGWTPTAAALTGNFHITIRGQVCVGRAREWNVGGRGGVEVLALAATGATP